MSHSLILRQGGGSDDSRPALSASLIVGICIIGAIFFCVILASVIRLCQRMPSQPSYSAETPPEYLFQPYAQEQVEHMREVRWLNHCNMWEVGRLARRELGERAGWEDTERPRLNRRTGVGWGFVVGKYGYLKRTSGYQEGSGREVEDAQSGVNMDGDTDQSMSNGPQQRSYAVTHHQQPRPTYKELDDDGQATDHLITEPFPAMPQIPGFEQRFQQHQSHHQRRIPPYGEQHRQSPMWNGGWEQVQARPINESVGTVVRKSAPKIVVSDHAQVFAYGKGHGEHERYYAREYEDSGEYCKGQRMRTRNLTVDYVE